MGLIIHVDGGSRGNPGPAGAGVVIADEHGRRVHEGAYFYARLTNNEAEYHALVRALERVERLADEPVLIRSDSELLVRQLTGEYQVKSPRLLPLVHRVQSLLIRRPRWSIEHVPRERNRRADELANLAMDRAEDVIVFDDDGASPPPPSPDPAGPASPDAGASPAARSDSGKRVHVSVHNAPARKRCAAGGCGFEAMSVGHTLPAGVCIYAAHALLPTLIAFQGMESGELHVAPTLTVRCARTGCDAVFHVDGAPSHNGRPQK